MARELVLSTETVRSHIKNILRKLDVNSREQAVAVADAMRGGANDPQTRVSRLRRRPEA